MSLDAYLAEHVMKWKRVKSLKHFEKGTFITNDEGAVIAHDWPSNSGFFAPDTNPAAAFAVLEKCAEETVLEDCTYIGTTGSEWIVGHTTRNFEEVADSLSLAICLFAQKLFSESQTPARTETAR